MKGGIKMEHKSFKSENIKTSNDKTAYLIFLTDDPEKLDEDAIAQITFPDSDDAGCIHPPRGFGKTIFTDAQMKKADGLIELIDINTETEELRKILKEFDALAIDEGTGLLIPSLDKYIGLIKSKKYKYAKVFEIDNQN